MKIKLMRNDSLKAQLIYRIVLVAICLTGTIFAFVDNADHIARVFLFYTNWSVFLALATSIITLVDTILKLRKGLTHGYNDHCPILKFIANITVIATFIVGGFVLHQFADTVGHIFRHLLIPVLTVLDTVIFDDRNRYSLAYPFLGVTWSLAYWVIVIVRFCIARGSTGIPEAEWDNYYPYGFTNIDHGHSLGGLIGLLAGIMVGLIAIGFIYYLIDKCHFENKKIVFDKTVKSK